MSQPFFKRESESLCLASDDWWSSDQWTDKHFEVAKRLMRKIRILSPDRDDDVIQDIAMRYSTAIKDCNRTNPDGWLYTLLHNRAIEVHDKEYCIRGKTRQKNKPKRFVSIDALDRIAPSSGKNCKEWRHLVARVAALDESVSADDQRVVVTHCQQCAHCAFLANLLMSQRIQIGMGIVFTAILFQTSSTHFWEFIAETKKVRQFIRMFAKPVWERKLVSVSDNVRVIELQRLKWVAGLHIPHIRSGQCAEISRREMSDWIQRHFNAA